MSVLYWNQNIDLIMPLVYIIYMQYCLLSIWKLILKYEFNCNENFICLFDTRKKISSWLVLLSVPEPGTEVKKEYLLISFPVMKTSAVAHRMINARIRKNWIGRCVICDVSGGRSNRVILSHLSRICDHWVFNTLLQIHLFQCLWLFLYFFFFFVSMHITIKMYIFWGHLF
jgi:hypothetical protein